MRRFFLGVLLLLMLAGPSFAQDSSALINEALDKVVTLQVDGVLPQAVKKVTDQTAVPITVEQQVYDLLPWGEQTNIKAAIQNQTLRQALTAICQKLGLTFSVGPQSVKLQPMPALARLGRRATVQELEALDLMSRTPLGQGATDTVGKLVDAVDRKLADAKSQFAVEYRPGENANTGQAINVPRNATLEDALEQLAKQTNLTWYPWGKSIVIVPKEEQVGQQLRKAVNGRFRGEDVAQVLTVLSQAAGVEFSLEPGAIQRVPPEFRKITLLLDNATVRQALDDIRGVTGLDYVIKPEGVYLWNQNANPAVTAPATQPSQIFGSLQLDNGIVLFLRDKDLPPDIREFAEHKKQQEYKRLRQMMKDEQFVPQTQPATKPASNDL
ncbi:MAG: hypothetical protein JWO87_2110 [Phycisphaerales bacterium]|nr:hypothetical protein [Phycisphaerales bacterium]MDB5305366.1 hypothetical protein [Phycisphaerales bacterium]